MLEIAALFAGMLLSSTAALNEPADYLEYIKSVRDIGMGGEALMAVRSIASITSGGSTLTYEAGEDCSSYIPRFASTSCPPRNADPAAVAATQAADRERLATEVQRLRPVADADGSGFVSTAEAAEFRRLIEFGHLMHHLTAVERASDETIACATRLDSDRRRERIRAYDTVARRINESHAGTLLPLLPVIGPGAP